jgi:hypothetical protein
LPAFISSTIYLRYHPPLLLLLLGCRLHPAFICSTIYLRYNPLLLLLLPALLE